MGFDVFCQVDMNLHSGMLKLAYRFVDVFGFESCFQFIYVTRETNKSIGGQYIFLRNEKNNYFCDRPTST